MVKKLFFLILLLTVALNVTQAKKQDKRQTEASEAAKRFKNWLEQDVVYIITPEERDVFKKLTSAEEKEKFIDLFWQRRNSAEGSQNEFKEEHYRRIAYANERFASGIPGWKTDRGRIYIMYGKPDGIESHPSGGSYNRPYWEGGGTTSTYPFETWRYRYLPGIGQDVEIEFVDKSMSGEYRMAMSPDEKDALLMVPGAGLTLDEEMGLSTKADRPYFHPTADIQRAGMRAKDMPFERLALMANLQKPPEIKFKDLQAVVTTKITYNQLPLQFRTDLIRIGKETSLVPITVEIKNSDLEFRKDFSIYRGLVNVYGSITSVTGRIEREFEDVISTDFLEGELEKGKEKRSIYQKLVTLKPGLYKVDLVVKDINSGSISAFKRSFSIPKYSEENLLTSSLMLATNVQPVKNLLIAQREHFVIGDLKVVPNVQGQFKKGETLNLYLQVYNAAVDQAKLAPSVKVEYLILDGKNVVKKIDDPEGKSVQFFSAQRVVLVKSIPLTDLSPGDYKVRVNVVDNISNKQATAESPLKVQ